MALLLDIYTQRLIHARGKYGVPQETGIDDDLHNPQARLTAMREKKDGRWDSIGVEDFEVRDLRPDLDEALERESMIAVDADLGYRYSSQVAMKMAESDISYNNRYGSE